MFVFQLPSTYRNLFGSEFLGGAPTSICDFVLRVFVFPFVPKSKNVYSICYDVYGGGTLSVKEFRYEDKNSEKVEKTQEIRIDIKGF